MPPFCYHRPRFVGEALELLGRFGDEAKVLAGGQSLLPLMAMRLSRPAHVVDIGRIRDLPAIDERDGSLVIGAMVRHADAERSDLVAHTAPLVAAAMPHIGHRAIRNRGTLCGSLAHADPAAELPAVALALDAELIVWGSEGERAVPAAEFFLGYLSSDIGDDELLCEVRFPPWSETAGWSLQEVSRRHGDYALVGMATVLEADPSGRISRSAIAVFGVAGTPVRMHEAERLLVGEPPGPELFSAAAEAVRRELDPTTDIHGTSAYRKHLGAVLTRRCLAEAAQPLRADR